MGKNYCLCIGILLCMLLAGACREKKSSQGGGDTQVEWVQKTWDFGELTAGEEVCHTFRFKNTGDRAFIIKKVETGCSCTTVNYDRAPVPPGKEGKIEITFNSSGRYGKQYKEIRIFANLPENYTAVRFTANVRE